MTQLARLYLRGAIAHKIKSLTDEQRDEVEMEMERVASDPGLQNTKYEFCNALKTTISRESANQDASMAEFYIAVMKAVVAAKYGYGTKEPASKEVFTDAVQRKKWFQTWVFEFLRQILRENKIPGYKQTKLEKMPADRAAIQEIENLIKQNIKLCEDIEDKRLLRSILKTMDVVESNDKHDIFIDQWILPLDVVLGINELANKYLNHNVKITQDNDRITIEALNEVLPTIHVKRQTETRVKFSSFETKRDDDDEGNRYFLEFEVSTLKNQDRQNEYIESDTIRVLRESIPDDAIKVLDLIVDPPVAYIEKYGNKAYKSNMAKFLGTTPREVEKHMNAIRHHALLMGIGL